ncbi:MAG: HAMP domain-containing histidine kinase [Rhizobiaceae bacterium]|nr:HAMP domain-containing histidine kinase [Rhizobiaceae bacterium]
MSDAQGHRDDNVHLGADGLSLSGALGAFEGGPISITDTTNKKNLLLLIQLRWIAVAGQVATIAVVHFWMGMGLPLKEMAAVVLFLVGLNLVSLYRYRRQERVTNTELLLELLLDVAALTVQLYLSGGATNPFISLYLLQVILGAILLEAWSVWSLVAITSACFVVLTFLYRPLGLPHQHGDIAMNLHIQGMFICFVLAACLLVLFITRITRNLRERDGHLAEIRQHSAEEQHILRMGLLASGAAHELGTPLATLSVILGDWRSMPEFRDSADLSQELAEMQTQLDRCKTIVSGILMSSGEARGEGTIRTTASSFIRDVAAEWRAARGPRQFEVEDRLDDDVPMVADLALKQVIFNLLDNALEASPDWVSLDARIESDRLAVVVRDRGPGFAPDLLGQVGRPYTTTKQRPGAGLGLFLVFNVVRKLGGRVDVRSDGDGGAMVEIGLPLAALGGANE